MLDAESIQKVRAHPLSNNGQFDIVHSWGVLHHSGSMLQAIRNSAALVAERGYLVLAIYQAHWSSALWKRIKYLYNRSPAFVRPLWIWLFYPVIYLAKWIVTGKNPKSKNRGMDFYNAVVDWVEGHPYEYAHHAEVTLYLTTLYSHFILFPPP